MDKSESSQLNPVAHKYAQYINPTFIKLLGLFGYGRIYTKAQDVWIWDQQDQKYLDFLAGFGSVNIGHNHPRLAKRLQQFFSENPLNLCHIGPSAQEAALGEALIGKASKPLQIAMFSSSGAEAVEAGMKIAKVFTKRKGFLYCQGGFHGTNQGVLSIMGEKRLKKPFGSLLQDCQQIPFGDLETLKKQLKTKKFAGFVVEPIQSEAGVIIPPKNYLKEAQELCQQTNTLLILDEVQTGLGRTGTFFAYEAEGFIPDILVLAKALSGSLAPIGATLTSEKIFKKAYGTLDRFDLHSSTFGGNAFSCVTAQETLSILEEEKLIENSRIQGEKLREGLKEKLSGHPFVKDIRGRGLLVAIEIGPTSSQWINHFAPFLVKSISKNIFGQWMAVKLLEKGIICQPASHAWNVLKLEPPLTIQNEEIRWAIQTIGEVFEEYQNISFLLKEVVSRLRKQAKKNWTFA